MSSEMIEQMVTAVQDGYRARSVWETSLTYAPGSSVKVNKATSATDPNTGASLTIPEGEVVTILGVGGGPSGVDHHVLRPNGSQAIVPFYNLGESTLKKNGASLSEALVGVVKKVVLTKPLPQSVIDWVGGGYADYGVELPDVPMDDSSSAVTFLMKSEDEEMMSSAMDSLKKAAGGSFKSEADSDLTAWAGATVG